MVRLANDPPLEPTILLNALRRPGDEVQLTQAIGELAKHDAHFAEGLLHLLIDRAPNGQAAAARLMPGAPVRCELERPMRAPDQTSRGRIELKLTQGPSPCSWRSNSTATTPRPSSMVTCRRSPRPRGSF